MTQILENILEFAKKQHGNQIRKYTGEPYWHHLVEVKEIISEYDNSETSLAIALLHDVYEDTSCTTTMLMDALTEFGMSDYNALLVHQGIIHLTDVFTKEAFSHLNRKQRKLLEAERLGNIPAHCQSIKYADIISNTKSICEHDPTFSIIYLQEKNDMLSEMRKGDIKLFIKCCDSINK